jgi:hypothetical protein
MSDDKQPEKKRFHYFVDGTKYESEQENVSGAYIKQRIPNFNQAYALYEEGRGQEKDKLIADETTVNLDEEKGGAKKFYTVPPATFGRA